MKSKLLCVNIEHVCVCIYVCMCERLREVVCVGEGFVCVPAGAYLLMYAFAHNARAGVGLMRVCVCVFLSVCLGVWGVYYLSSMFHTTDAPGSKRAVRLPSLYSQSQGHNLRLRTGK